MTQRAIEAIFAKTRVTYEAHIRTALIDLDEIDTTYGDRYIDMIRDITNGIAQERLGRTR